MCQIRNHLKTDITVICISRIFLQTHTRLSGEKIRDYIGHYNLMKRLILSKAQGHNVNRPIQLSTHTSKQNKYKDNPGSFF